jgi:hypothetical protein
MYKLLAIVWLTVQTFHTSQTTFVGELNFKSDIVT